MSGIDESIKSKRSVSVIGRFVEVADGKNNDGIKGEEWRTNTEEGLLGSKRCSLALQSMHLQKLQYFCSRIRLLSFHLFIFFHVTRHGLTEIKMPKQETGIHPKLQG